MCSQMPIHPFPSSFQSCHVSLLMHRYVRPLHISSHDTKKKILLCLYLYPTEKYDAAALTYFPLIFPSAF